MRHMMNQVLSERIESWADSVKFEEQLRRNTRLLQRTIARMMNRDKHLTFVSWRNNMIDSEFIYKSAARAASAVVITRGGTAAAAEKAQEVIPKVAGDCEWVA